MIADILLYQNGRPKSCKMAASRLKPWECVIFVKIVVFTKNLAMQAHTRTTRKFFPLEVPGSYAISYKN